MTKLKSLILLIAFISLVSCNSSSIKVSGDAPAISNKATTNNTNSGNLNKSEILAQHNKHRQVVGIPSLRWSEPLAQYAQDWATQLQSKGCGLIHRPNTGKYKQLHGENLFYAGPVKWSNGAVELQNMTPKLVVDSWALEKADYSYASNRCKAGKVCGHYTQVVWKKSTQVGCASAVCADKSQVMVCNYNPPGNYNGQRPY